MVNKDEYIMQSEVNRPFIWNFTVSAVVICNACRYGMC